MLFSVQQKHLAITGSLLSCAILASDRSRKGGQLYVPDTVTKMNFFCKFSNKNAWQIMDEIQELEYPHFGFTQVWYFNGSERKVREGPTMTLQDQFSKLSGCVSPLEKDSQRS